MKLLKFLGFLLLLPVIGVILYSAVMVSHARARTRARAVMQKVRAAMKMDYRG